MSSMLENTRGTERLSTTWLRQTNEVIRVSLQDNKRKESILQAPWLLYGKPLSPAQVALFLELLEDYSSQAVDAAVTLYMKDENPSRANPRGPFPADLIKYMDPQPSQEEQAIEIANQILRKVKSCGRPNPGRAKAELSPAAYAVVYEARGSWENMCAAFDEPSGVGTTLAQLRTTAASVLARQQRAARKEAMAPYLGLTAETAAQALSPAHQQAAAAALPERQRQAEAVVDVVEQLARRRALA